MGPDPHALLLPEAAFSGRILLSTHLDREGEAVHGEIDLIASRRRRIAFVEVKRRRTLADCEAALTPRQAERIARAADHWIARHPRYGQHEIGLDAILIARGRLPRHLPNALDSA